MLIVGKTDILRTFFIFLWVLVVIIFIFYCCREFCRAMVKLKDRVYESIVIDTCVSAPPDGSQSETSPRTNNSNTQLNEMETLV